MLTLAELVRSNARRDPSRTAVVHELGRLTHAELADRATALARGLLRLGVTRGDRVAVLAGNGAFAVETLLGCALVGAVYVPCNWRWTSTELCGGLEVARPSVFLVEEAFQSEAEAALEVGGDAGRRPEALAVRSEGDPELFVSSGPLPDGAVELDDPLCVLFTGGTTGRSKGVVLSHRAAMTNAINELIDCGFGQGPLNTGLAATPLFHSAALLCVLLPHYVTCGTVVLARRFDEEHVAELIGRERVTATFMIPNMIRRLLRAGVLEDDRIRTHLRQVHSGGGLLRMPDKLAATEVLPDVRLFFRYGLTEAGPMVTRLLPEDVLRPELDGSIGQAYTFTEVQVHDPGGREVPAGELGEIRVRGANLMEGYLDAAEATAAVFHDGWLCTGDLAVRDEHGYLFFRDRAKDMIKTGGENVYASEIEQLLYAHPAVMECGVVGVPSDEWDEEVRVAIALREPDAVGEAELRTYLRFHLAGYKVPKVFAFVAAEDMPVNPSGKVVKSELRGRLGW